MPVPKIFISHANKDKLIVDAFVNLLTKAGIPEEQIVSSSTPGTQLHTGKSLYAELKKELSQEKLLVIFMLSENFYASTVCQNEMGAAWFRGVTCEVVLLPGFTFGQVKGVICENNLIGIALDTYDKESADRFNHLRNDLTMFGFTLSADNWNLAILDFYVAVENYKSQHRNDIVLDMTDVEGFCIGETVTNGCRVIRKHSSKEKTTVIVDFDKTNSTLCSIVYHVEQKDWSALHKNSISLCFNAYSDIEDLHAEVELHLADRNKQVPVSITDDTLEFRIPLSRFTSSIGAWKEVREIGFLFRKEYIHEKVTVVIENLRLEG